MQSSRRSPACSFAGGFCARRGNRKSLVDMPKAKGVDVRAELLRYYKCAALPLHQHTQA